MRREYTKEDFRLVQSKYEVYHIEERYFYHEKEKWYKPLEKKESWHKNKDLSRLLWSESFIKPPETPDYSPNPNLEYHKQMIETYNNVIDYEIKQRNEYPKVIQ